jgi:hypothetical protein
LTLTREQYLFWSNNMTFPSSCAYNMGFVLQLDAEVDERDLRMAVTRVVEKHPALLVHVSSDGTSQRQPTVSQWNAALARATELRTLPGLEAAAAATESAEAVTIDHPAVVAACSVAFDVTHSAPLRFFLAGKRALLLVAHHVVCDASSLSLLAEQLHASHAAIRAARLNGVDDGGVNVHVHNETHNHQGISNIGSGRISSGGGGNDKVWWCMVKLVLKAPRFSVSPLKCDDVLPIVAFILACAPATRPNSVRRTLLLRRSLVSSCTPRRRRINPPPRCR